MTDRFKDARADLIKEVALSIFTATYSESQWDSEESHHIEFRKDCMDGAEPAIQKVLEKLRVHTCLHLEDLVINRNPLFLVHHFAEANGLALPDQIPVSTFTISLSSNHPVATEYAGGVVHNWKKGGI